MAEPVSPETQSKIAAWRLRALDGSLSIDEMKEAIKILRGDRQAALQASTTSKRKAAAVAIPSAESMLDDLEAL